MSSQKSKSQRNNKMTVNQLKNMDYMQMIEHYMEYPAKGLKFTFNEHVYSNLSSVATGTGIGKNVKLELKGTKPGKASFVSEKDKADGWRDNYSSSSNYSKFLQTNLHFLPEHLWERAKEFRQDGVNVGMKVSDKTVHFFVHKADTDDLSRELYTLTKNRYDPNKVRIQEILDVFSEKGIESWLTIRAKSLL